LATASVITMQARRRASRQRERKKTRRADKVNKAFDEADANVNTAAAGFIPSQVLLALLEVSLEC